MKKHSSRAPRQSMPLLLQVAIVLSGFATLAFLLFGPLLVNGDAPARLLQLYFSDPFRVFMYVGSIPFFVALVKSFKLLGSIRQRKVVYRAAVRSAKIIKYCALGTLFVIVVAGEYVRTFGYSTNDLRGVVTLCLAMVIISVIMAMLAAAFENIYPKSPDRQNI